MKRLFLIITGGLFLLLLLLLLSGSTTKAQAQNRETIKKRERRSGLDSSNSRARAGESASIRRNAIEGKIRWKKTMGVPFDSTRESSCVFIVIPTVLEGAPGTLQTPKELKPGYAFEGRLYAEQDYYFCKYRLFELPSGVEITVTPQFEYERYATAYWEKTDESYPPQGQHRVVVGSAKVTLTNKAPTATVDFDVVIRPLPTPPR